MMGGMGLGLGLSRSGAAPFRPADLGTDLYDLWEAEDAARLTLSGSAVDAIASLKNSYSAAQSTAANKPTRDATGFNGRPVLTFDGVNDELTYAGVGNFPTGATPGEIWLLVDQTALVADTASRAAFSYGSSSAVARTVRRTVISGVNRAELLVGDGTTFVTIRHPTADFSGRHVLRARIGATESSLEVDGVGMTSVAVVPATGSVRTRLGATASTSPANLFQGGLPFVALTKPLTDAQAAKMLGYLKSRGGIS